MGPTTCYCCDAPATSDEHVPPQALFPKAKDDPAGIGFRQSLIKVPSCYAHNTAKSMEDEFLMAFLGMAEGINSVGEIQIPKLMRAYRRRPALLTGLMAESFPVISRDSKTGNFSETTGFHVDGTRINAALGQVAKGLHYHHFGSKWPERPEVMIQFARYRDRAFMNRQWKRLGELFDQIFAGMERHGSIPDVFYYQVFEDHQLRLIRAVFYGGCTVNFKFVLGQPHESGSPDTL